MKHLHYAPSLEPAYGGGVGVAALQLHQVMSEKSPCRLVSTREAGFTTTWPGVIQYPRSGPTAFFYSPDLRKAARDLVKEADCVHGHGLHVYPAMAVGGEALRQNKPLILHIHGFFDPWIVKRSRWKKSLVRMLFEGRNLREARFFRALTDKEEAQIRAMGFRNPIAVVPNGIDLAEIDSAPETPATIDAPHFARKRPRRFLFLSRLHPKKGLDILIESWAKLQAEFKDWELAIVGPEELGYRAHLEGLVKAANIESACSIFPAVSGHLKHQVYRSAELFVLPSYSEGFSMAVLEALANSLPVVISTECNFPLVAQTGAGWECLPDAASLTTILREALSSGPVELRQRGEIGRRTVEAQFTLEKISDSLQAACVKFC